MIGNLNNQKLFGLIPSKPEAGTGNETENTSLLHNDNEDGEGEGGGGGDVESGLGNTDYGSPSSNASKVAEQKQKENEVEPKPIWLVRMMAALSFTVSFLALLLVIHFFGASTAAIVALYILMLWGYMWSINRFERLQKKIRRNFLRFTGRGPKGNEVSITSGDLKKLRDKKFSVGAKLPSDATLYNIKQLNANEKNVKLSAGQEINEEIDVYFAPGGNDTLQTRINKDEGKFSHVIARDSFQVDFADGEWKIIHKRGDEVIKEGTMPLGQKFINVMGIWMPVKS